jgi:DNA-directed RNA polymerase specialized sigma24 family protein
MDLATYEELRARARRLTRGAADADDLVQEVLLVALRAGRSDPGWLGGVLQHQAALSVRREVRRRRRERDAEAASDASDASVPVDLDALLPRLPPAARRVAVLALHGLAPDEIRWVLDLAPTAFRQRLSTIRKVLGALPPAQRAEALALAYVRDPARSADLQFGLIRRALKTLLGHGPGLATHDSDGHLLVIRSRAHTFASSGNE